MLKNVSHIYTFLIVYETKSFSKAAEILEISQPAITQKMKQLEKFLGFKLIERKKNGIILTAKGKSFLEISQNLKECMDNTEIRINHLKKESVPITIGATSSIGNYILPIYLPHLRELLKKNINIVTKDNLTLIKQLENRKFDVIFTTLKLNDEEIEFIPLLKDEIVFFSNKPLPKELEFKDLFKYNFICRENGSTIRQEVSKTIKKQGFSCDNLHIKSFVDNSTTLKFTILNATETFVSMATISSIEEELKQNRLFITRLKNIDLQRTIYLAYLKSNDDISIKSIKNYLTNITF